MANRPPLPELNDAQKGDLAQLWERHAPNQSKTLSQPASSRGGRGGRGRGRGGSGNRGVAPTTVVTMDMEDADYTHICQLYAFFRWCICKGLRSRRECENTGSSSRTVTPDASSQSSRTWQSMMFLFEKFNRNRRQSDRNIVQQNETGSILPKIRGGTQIISFDHLLFMQEFNEYEKESQPTLKFGSHLLYHPDRAIACAGCAIGLVVKSAWRQNQTTSLLQNGQNPQLSTLDTAIYKPRFYNLAPSNQMRMAHVRTSTVDTLISLRGTVTKARPKRLRVLDAGFTCCKCGLTQICKLVDGKYSSPTRCVDIKCRSSKFTIVRKVANFCDVQELRIQESREEFCDDFENGQPGMGSIGRDDGNRESGRAPRHIEVEVCNDLVDQCNAGEVDMSIVEQHKIDLLMYCLISLSFCH